MLGGSRWGEDSSGTSRDRGLSEILGFVLLLGIVVTSAMVVLYFGGGLLTELQTQTQGQSAEQTMREADSRLSEVALSDNLEHTIAVDERDNQEVWIEEDAEMDVVLENEDGNTCDFNIPMGSLHYETDDHSTVTYQGGGVWKESPSGNTMVSSPDMEYRDGTLTFPSVNIKGSVDGDFDRLQAKKNLEDSRARSQAYEDELKDCVSDDVDASELRITVTSRYADVWGQYLEREVSEDVSYNLDDSNPDDSSVTVTISNGIDASVGDGADGVEVGKESTVEVTVLGTEVSSEWCTDWDYHGCSEYVKNWAPVSVGIIADGTEMRPWPENLNTRDTQLKEWSESFEVEPEDDEVTITLSSTLWNCRYTTGAGSDWYDRATWEHRECGDRTDSVREIDATAGDNPTNVRVLADGDEMPVIETDYRQRNAEEVLGPMLDDSGHLELADNQMVFLFELTQDDASWSNAIDNDGSGDPDYNDVIALLEIEDQEGAETSGGFNIRLTTTDVVIEPAD